MQKHIFREINILVKSLTSNRPNLYREIFLFLKLTVNCKIHNLLCKYINIIMIVSSSLLTCTATDADMNIG